MAGQIKIYDVTIPTDRDEAAKLLKKEVWPTLQPSWNSHEIVSKALNSGYVNCMTIYHTMDDDKQEHAVIVRVFNTDFFPVEIREKEFVKMQIATHMGCFPTILAVMKNGVIYECAPGRCLRAEDFENLDIIRKISRSLAQFHWFTPSATANLVDRKGKKINFQKRNVFMEQMKKDFAGRVKDVTDETDEARTKRQHLESEMEKEIPFVEEYLKDMDLPVANCHGDFHGNNIIYDDDSGRVTIVDYEISNDGMFALFDFAYLFGLHEFKDDAGKVDIPSGPPSEEIKRVWIKAYLGRKCEMEGRDPKDTTDTEIELWMTHLEILSVVNHIIGAIGCLPYLNADFEFDLVRIARQLFDRYQEEKHALGELKEKYLKISAQLA